MRLNSGTMASATALYIDQYDQGGANNLQNFLSSLANYGNSTRRGYFKIENFLDIMVFTI